MQFALLTFLEAEGAEIEWRREESKSEEVIGAARLAGLSDVEIDESPLGKLVSDFAITSHFMFRRGATALIGMNGLTLIECIPELSRLDALIHYVQDAGRVCPMPDAWNKLWELLPDRHRADSGWERAPPLILAAWHCTSPLDKRNRLLEHVRYAESHGALDDIDQYLRGLDDSKWSHNRDW